MRRLACLAAIAMAVLALAPAARADFGVDPGSFFAKTHPHVPIICGGVFGCRPDIEAIESAPPVTQAGAHPDATTVIGFEQGPSVGTSLREVKVHAPPGFLGNPGAVTPCGRPEFQLRVAVQHGGCPPSSQVGVVYNEAAGEFYFYPVYLLTPAPGQPASLGFPYRGFQILLKPDIRSESDYGLTIAARQIIDVFHIDRTVVTLWGSPADPIHDPERYDDDSLSYGASSEAVPSPFTINPTFCGSGPLMTSVQVRSWQRPERLLPLEPFNADYRSEAPEPTGCSKLAFGGVKAPATLTMQPEVRAAETPTGFATRLRLPYNDDPKGLANPTLRDTVVTLPEGVRVNPASAAGLGACTSDQVGLTSAIGATPIRFDRVWAGPDRCPDASKIATVQVTTPLLEEPLDGAAYLGAQLDNPFGSMLAIYIVIDDPSRGLTIKLAGRVRTDPESGRVTASFEDNPQLPFTEFDLRFFGGPRAALVTPRTCGEKTTSTVLTPWSAPDTLAVSSNDSFEVVAGPGARACAPTEEAARHAPGFEAGTVTPIAAADSPFLLRLRRADGDQELRALDVALAPGLTGRLAGVPYCPEAAIAAARSRTNPGDGAAELAAPSCPAASRVGRVDVAAGAGPSPIHVDGTAYLAGPYRGAPLSTVIVTPAVAGPFDLGVVVVRAALRVDPATARITAVSDPIPDLLRVGGDGFPLSVRSVAVEMDRPGFTRNPSSCAPLAVDAAVGSVLGQQASLSYPFRVGACRALGFEPRLNLRLKGATKRGKNPRLIANLRARPGEANISRAQVKLPRAAFLDQSHIGTVCTRVQWAADACPARSVYGKVVARTPLLDYPLRGRLFLRSSRHKLPDLVADLRGPAHQPIRIELVGRTDSVKGALRNTFDLVPDAPVSHFRLELFGGKRGLVILSRDICRGKHRAAIKLNGQNGMLADTAPVVANDCRKGKKKR